MPIRVAPRAACLALLSFAALATPAHAEDPSDGGQAPEPLGDPDAAPGELFGIVFASGTGEPLAGQAVVVDGEVAATTDALGRFRIEATPGVHELAVRTPDGRLEPLGPYRVESGFVTEVLVTWFAEYPPNVQSEQPEEGAGATVTLDEATAGTVKGQVLSQETGAPIAGARVFVRGSRLDAKTDADGFFELALPEGEYDLSFVHDKHATQALNNVRVTREQTTPLSVELVPAGLALEDFTIKAPKVEGGSAALLDERRKSSAVGDVLGAEAMSKSGDSSAASALRRVTGLTVVGGKFVYVRGLGERYSATTLNGAQLPSPEPERRVIPLDMFPSGILESVVIQKTFSPDIPGGFGGGLVQLRTRRVPQEPFFSASVSGGFNTFTTFQESLNYQGAPTDWLGVTGDSRTLSPEIEEATQDQRLLPGNRFTDAGFTPEELERLGETTIGVAWTPDAYVIPPDIGVSVNAGGGTTIGGREIGALIGLSYDNSWTRRIYRRAFYNLGTEPGTLVEQSFYDFEDAENTVNVSGIFAVGFKPADGHEIRATSLALRMTDDQTRVYEGYSWDATADVRVTRFRYVERMLLAQQLEGDHLLWEDGPTLSWRGQIANATRLEPDRRQTLYQLEGDRYEMSTRADGNGRLFSTLDDMIYDGAVDLSVPFGAPVGIDEFRPTIKAGAGYLSKTRDVETRRFQFGADRQFIADNPGIMANDPEDLFNEENISPDGFEILEYTRETDNYSAYQTVASGYLMAEVPFTPWFRAMAGARVEANLQVAQTFALFSATDELIEARVESTDILPATTLTFAPINPLQIRAAYGRTVNRPDLRELSPAPFSDVVGGGTQFGNPDLKRAIIDHLDLRVEYYPGPGETLSVSGFFKSFTDPIESILLAGSGNTQSYANVPSATIAGVEFDVKKTLGFISEPLRDAYVGGNVALIASQVDLGDTGIQTSTTRPLQGQSPYVINLQAGWDNPETGHFATLLYNVFGPRIINAGGEGTPDTYEQPIHQLDFVLGLEFDALRVGFKAKNLLDWPSVVTIGEYTQDTRRRGVDLSLKIGVAI